jgi:hypothetical protein
VSGAHRGSIEGEETAPLEDPVDDGLGEVFVVKDSSPCAEGFVGGEDHGASAAMTLVDHVEEHVRRVGTVGQIAHLVDDEDRRMGVGREGLGEAPLTEGGRELVDELGGRGEESIEAVLDGPVGDGDGEVCLAASRLAQEDEAASFGDEVGGESGAEERQPHGGLEGEVEVVDGLEEGEAGPSRESTETCLLALGDLLRDEQGEEVPEGPLLLLRPLDEAGPDPAGVGEVEPLEQMIELVVAGLHGRLSREGSGGLTVEAVTWRRTRMPQEPRKRPRTTPGSTPSSALRGIP